MNAIRTSLLVRCNGNFIKYNVIRYAGSIALYRDLASASSLQTTEPGATENKLLQFHAAGTAGNVPDVPEARVALSPS